MSAAERARYLPMILSSAGQHDSAKKVADLLAELDQAKSEAGVRFRERLDIESERDAALADDMVRHVADQRNEAMSQRDAALATLREVRELHNEYAIHPASEDGYEMWRTLGSILDRGPR